MLNVICLTTSAKWPHSMRLSAHSIGRIQRNKIYEFIRLRNCVRFYWFEIITWFTNAQNSTIYSQLNMLIAYALCDRSCFSARILIDRRLSFLIFCWFPIRLWFDFDSHLMIEYWTDLCHLHHIVILSWIYWPPAGDVFRASVASAPSNKNSKSKYVHAQIQRVAVRELCGDLFNLIFTLRITSEWGRIGRIIVYGYCSMHNAQIQTNCW